MCCLASRKEERGGRKDGLMKTLLENVSIGSKGQKREREIERHDREMKGLIFPGLGAGDGYKQISTLNSGYGSSLCTFLSTRISPGVNH